MLECVALWELKTGSTQGSRVPSHVPRISPKHDIRQPLDSPSSPSKQRVVRRSVRPLVGLSMISYFMLWTCQFGYRNSFTGPRRSPSRIWERLLSISPHQAVSAICPAGLPGCPGCGPTGQSYCGHAVIIFTSSQREVAKPAFAFPELAVPQRSLDALGVSGHFPCRQEPHSRSPERPFPALSG